MERGIKYLWAAIINGAMTCGLVYFVLYAIICCFCLDDKSGEFTPYLYIGLVLVMLLSGVIVAVMVKNKPIKEQRKIARMLNFVVFFRKLVRGVKKELLTDDDDD